MTTLLPKRALRSHTKVADGGVESGAMDIRSVSDYLKSWMKGTVPKVVVTDDVITVLASTDLHLPIRSSPEVTADWRDSIRDSLTQTLKPPVVKTSEGTAIESTYLGPVGDLEKEFGSGPDDAAEMKLAELAGKFLDYASPGKVTSALIAKGSVDRCRAYSLYVWQLSHLPLLSRYMNNIHEANQRSSTETVDVVRGVTATTPWSVETIRDDADGLRVLHERAVATLVVRVGQIHGRARGG
ncbi:hypothetical protein F442_22973 [Phytophthora nicotianae P10297]|uniref:Uncharacterized protein n=1 Tax=Phytophthora nicotianae P10297 TaxID=1317064 RepID=W2XYI7_PHYNI|nr:hypothetical protein F442_22973 [Phytophthora nicotianae P10297]